MIAFNKNLFKIVSILFVTLALVTLGACGAKETNQKQETTESRQETEKKSETKNKKETQGEIFTKKEDVDFESLKVNIALGAFNYNGNSDKSGYDIYWDENTFEEKISIDAYIDYDDDDNDGDDLVIETTPDNAVTKNLNGDVENKNKVTVFKNGQVLDDVKMRLGIGIFNIDALKAEECELKTGVGELKINGMDIHDEATLETGVGAVAIQNANIHDLKLKAGIGAVTIEGVLTGETEIENGIGETKLKICGNINDYKFDIDKGVSTLKINGERYEGLSLSDNGPHTIKIDSGVGDISIEFID